MVRSRIVGTLTVAMLVSLTPVAQAASPLPGGTCTKLNQKTTIAKVSYTCLKNSKKKLVWTRSSALLSPTRCASIKQAYDESKAGYDSAVTQLAELEAKINDPALSKDGSIQVDNLKKTVATLRTQTLPLLKSLVDDAGDQYTTGCVK